MLESTVTDKGQTTVPKQVRQALGIKPRQRLQWEIEANGTATVRPEPSALALFGSLKTRRKFPSLKAEQDAVRRRVAEHAAHEGKHAAP